MSRCSINNRWKLDDSRHNRILHDFIMRLAINIYRQIAHLESNFSTLQKFTFHETIVTLQSISGAIRKKQ